MCSSHLNMYVHVRIVWYNSHHTTYTTTQSLRRIRIKLHSTSVSSHYVSHYRTCGVTIHHIVTCSMICDDNIQWVTSVGDVYWMRWVTLSHYTESQWSIEQVALHTVPTLIQHENVAYNTNMSVCVIDIHNYIIICESLVAIIGVNGRRWSSHLSQELLSYAVE